MFQKRIAVLVLATLVVAVAACGGSPSVDGRGLAACLGSQDGSASGRTDQAVFEPQAQQAEAFIDTFEVDTDGSGSRDAVPTELYLMADSGAADKAKAAMAKAVAEPQTADIVEQRGNLLLVFARQPSRSQMQIINGCLDDAGASDAGQRTTLWTAAKAKAYEAKTGKQDLAELTSNAGEYYRTEVSAMLIACLLGSQEDGWPAQWYGTTNLGTSAADEDPLFEREPGGVLDLRPVDPEADVGVAVPADELPAAPRVQLILLHPEYDEQGAREYIAAADQRAEQELLGDPGNLSFKPVLEQEDEGVVISEPGDRAPDARQLATLRDCYRQASSRFAEMLEGKRKLGDWTR